MPSTPAALAKPRKVAFKLTVALPANVKTADVQRRVKEALAELKPTAALIPAAAPAPAPAPAAAAV